MREIIQIYQQRLHYLVETVNLISWVLYISALIMIAPAFRPDGAINTMHYSAASIAVFLSWFRLLLFLQRFDQVGIYVVMFLEILQTLIKVLLVFSILIIAFGLAFYILLSKVSRHWVVRGMLQSKFASAFADHQRAGQSLVLLEHTDVVAAHLLHDAGRAGLRGHLREHLLPRSAEGADDIVLDTE